MKYDWEAHLKHSLVNGKCSINGRLFWLQLLLLLLDFSQEKKTTRQLSIESEEASKYLQMMATFKKRPIGTL